MDINQLKAKIAEIIALAKVENRSLNAAEITSYETLKAELAKLEAADLAAKDEIKKRNEIQTAAEEAQKVRTAKLEDADANTYFRSIAKGSNDVGNKEVIADVVRVYEANSQLFAAHKNVQKRSNGMAFSFVRIIPGNTAYVKTEGNAGTSDTGTTASPASVTFSTYSGQSVLITQESLDDYAADIAKEIIDMGLSTSYTKFGAAAVTAALTGFGTKDGEGSNYISTATLNTWAIADLVKAYYLIPARNRANAKFLCNSTMAATLVGLLTYDKAPQLAAIGLTAENIIVEDTVTASTVLIGDPTKYLAIGMKIPVRVFTQETSAGRTYEAQPRLAVALRDSTAMSGIVVKSS